MAISSITPKGVDVIKRLKGCKNPQKYISESTYRVRPILEQKVEYFSPFAATGVKLNRIG